MSGFVSQVDIDVIRNGVGEGSVAQSIANGRFAMHDSVGFDAGILRPVIMPDGNKYCVVKTGHMVANKKDNPWYVENKANGEMVPESEYIPLERLIQNGVVPYTFNATSIPYLAWQKIDRAVIKALRKRLGAWDDLAAANTFGGFDGMSVQALIREAMTDPGDAKMDMNTLSNDINDSPRYTPDILPLPIIHAGATMSERELAVSRNGGMPLDTTMIESSGRRVAEFLEKMTIGMTDFSGYVTGQSSANPAFSNKGIYGYRTQPDRITKTDVTTPGSPFDAEQFLADVIAMIELARAQNMFGPFTLYYSTQWDQHLSKDYVVGAVAAGLAAPAQTILQRVMELAKISAVKSLDFFTSTDPELLLIPTQSDALRAVNGMDFTTVRWVTDGGARNNLRVLGIKVPDLRSRFINQSTTARQSEIVHGTIS